MNQPFKTFVKNQLVQSAKSYSKLIVKRITIASESFEHAKSYSIRFYKTNFLHLTGVSTTLKPETFYEKCFNALISEDDFDIDCTPEQKGLIRLKMKHLPFINSFFDNDILAQEFFDKGSIKCLLATSDGKCTIGFVDAKYHIRPKTILDKNHLKKDRKIVTVKPIVVDVK